MDSVAIRVFSFSVLPVIIAAGHLGLDRTSRPRERRLESSCFICLGSVSREAELWILRPLLHSDSVAESIGWPTGNPFQLQVGFCQPGGRHPWHCRHGPARWLP
jgi:Family of unknown function (DUF6790)